MIHFEWDIFQVMEVYYVPDRRIDDGLEEEIHHMFYLDQAQAVYEAYNELWEQEKNTASIGIKIEIETNESGTVILIPFFKDLPDEDWDTYSRWWEVRPYKLVVK